MGPASGALPTRHGILAHAAYLPHWRLSRSEIPQVASSGGGQGTRAVASYDEDATTMAVEAGRLALRQASGVAPDLVLFSTTTPSYADRTNASAIQAALRLSPEVGAYDFNGASRSAMGALQLALRSPKPALVLSSDIRIGLPGGPDETAGGDGAAALLVGTDADGELLAELVGHAGSTDEFVDRWRAPGEVASRLWEERFGEGRYLAAGEAAWEGALKAAGLTSSDIDHLVVTGLHTRGVAAVVRRLRDSVGAIVDDLAATVGQTGAAHPALLLSATLESARPGVHVAVLSLADGADALVFRATEGAAAQRPQRPVAAQVAAGAALPYGRYLAWRGLLPVEPPRRPEPGRVSSSAAARGRDWKFGLVGSRSEDGSVRLPPSPAGGQDPAPMADARGVITTFTIDRMAYSPSPPTVFAVVDFDGGGRLPIDLTDVDADAVRIGDRVEMTFRRLLTVDGIHNYFWKARPS